MKSRFILIVTLLAFVAGVSTLTVSLINAQTTTPVTATPTPGRSTLLVADAFVRGGPGDTYVPVGAVSPTAALIPVSRNAAGDWVMIRYNRGFGWLRRDLAYWIVNIDALPIISTDDLTPSPVPGIATATAFFPTETPTGDYILVNAQSAYVRAGPGRTYLRLGQLYGGDPVVPVGRDETTDWIMIRFADGFGWIRRDLAIWVSDLTVLPVLTVDNLTPSPTSTPSITPSRTPIFTRTASNTPTLTPSDTATFTPTVTPSATFTATSTFTATPTITDTATDVPTLTPTLTPTSTLTSTSLPPSPTFTLTVTPVDTATNTVQPTATFTDLPSATFTVEASVTSTETLEPSATFTLTSTPLPPTSTYTPTVTETETEIPLEPSATFTTEAALIVPTSTTEPSATFTTEAATATFTLTPTETLPPPDPTDTITVSPTEEASLTAATDTPVPGVVIPPTEIIPTTPAGDTPPSQPGFNIRAEAILGGLGLLAVLGYIWLYMRGIAATERYAKGFVIDQCPVCQRGELLVDTTYKRTFGIPGARHTVRCSNCRSVLREIGYRRWRYAVDRLENIPLYDRLNNREIDEETLKLLLQNPVTGSTPFTPPNFVDGDKD